MAIFNKTNYDEKVTPNDNDAILLADSEDANIVKYGLYSKFKGATGATGPQGPAGSNGTNGTDGTDGTDGNGIASITTNKVGKTTTVTITEDDSTVTTFDVEDGADGAGSGDISGSGTANEIAYFTAEKTIDNLPVATYPSLTEVSYVKGVTSAIQTQLNAKGTGNGDMLLGTAQSVTETKTFTKDKLLVKGTSTGTTNLTTANTSANNYTATFPAKDGTVAMTADITGTNSNTNTGDQTIANTSDGTSHTVTLSASGGSVKLIEGPGITLTTGGTSGAGEVTIASTATGSSLWNTVAGTPTFASGTTFTVTGDYTTIFKKGIIIRWLEDSTERMAMVSIPSTYSAPDTTVTVIGDTIVTGAGKFGTVKYSGIALQTVNFAVAGTIGAVASDVANAFYASEPYRVIGADLSVGTAGTTNNTTVDINKGGTTMFTTKPTLATTVASSPTPFTADTATSLALGDRVSIDIDAVQTTAAVDLYVRLYLVPTRFLALS